MLSAAIQLTAGADLRVNLAAAVEAVHAAADAGARLVVLPEKWRSYGGGRGALDAVAEPLDGPLVQELAALAAERSIDLVAGSVSEPGPPGDPRLFNNSLHLRPDGALAAAYRKVHLFDADVAGRRYRESDHEQPGDRLAVSPLGTDPAFTAGLAICFDLRFPELFGELADAGANVITLPSAFTERTTRDHWEVLVRARAIEVGAFVVAANQVGEHPDGSRSGGSSLIVDPWGEVLARGEPDRPGVILADLDPAAVQRAREALPVRGLRRPEVYARQGPVAAAGGAAGSDSMRGSAGA